MRLCAKAESDAYRDADKLMDYMMAGRAVLHSVEAGNDPVAEAGCGITVAPQNARAVANGLLKMLALAPTALAVMGDAGASSCCPSTRIRCWRSASWRRLVATTGPERGQAGAGCAGQGRQDRAVLA